MSSVPPWFGRTFDFTFPVEQHPNLCIRLRGTPARLEEIVRGIPRDVLILKPGDKWSAQEHAGHLVDLELLWTARVDDFVAGGATLTAADLRNLKTEEASHNTRDVEEILGEFRAARRRLLDRVSALPCDTLARTMLHPRLKQPMRLVDHLFFAAEHDDHHLAVISELVRQPEEPPFRCGTAGLFERG
jgi:uncharacterized damage-inducible protein DinB